MNGYVYILQSLLAGRYYIGSATNVEKRLRQHKEGRVYTTKRMLPVELVFVQRYKTVAEAKQIEFKLKKLKRKDYIRKIVMEGQIRLGL